MSSYISSNENRFYTALETSFGEVSPITAERRIPAVRLAARQTTEKATRRDKTGGRSFLGVPTGVRRKTSFNLKTYLTSWADQSKEPSYGPLFQAAMGSAPAIFAGGTVQTVENGGKRLRLAAAHGLSAGQAIAAGGDMRFVTTVVDAQTVDLSAPFVTSIAAGSPVGPTVTYKLAKALPSVSIFDYWSPVEAVQRILHGAAVNDMKIAVNGDFHEFEFAGPARDLIDSTSFVEGEAGLTAWPAEPDIEAFDYSIIPGHIGQVWLGSAPDRFFTLTEAALKLDNGIDGRVHEFGLDGLRAIAPGERAVTVDFEIFANDEAATKDLYQAARQRSPIHVMLQLGQQPGQLFGAYLKSVQLETPGYDDGESRLRWEFSGCRAQGSADDELIVAFG
jgi:hypothetical protein